MKWFKRLMTFLSLPYVIWTLLFTVVPCILIVYYALTTSEGQFTLQNLIDFCDPIYINVLLRSLSMAVLCTFICLLLGYPAAYFLSRKHIDARGTLVLLFIIPMWMNFLLRTYAWLSLLENNGLITSTVNMILSWFGAKEPIRLLYTYNAVLMGMVYNYLPFMILPIYSVLTKISDHLVEAAQDLGANQMQVFFRVTLPLSLPGIVSGITMVFMPAVTTFVISRLLGGGQHKLFGDLIEQQFLFANNWHFGSALSLIMMILILLSMGFMNRYSGKESGGLM